MHCFSEVLFFLYFFLFYISVGEGRGEGLVVLNFTEQPLDSNLFLRQMNIFETGWKKLHANCNSNLSIILVSAVVFQRTHQMACASKHLLAFQHSICLHLSAFNNLFALTIFLVVKQCSVVFNFLISEVLILVIPILPHPLCCMTSTIAQSYYLLI